ncbi:MAG TPA: magnesium-translocating P-type ATPase [Saprospiraceae bacterium]|nr:magnesium-translocating P-type ATPase [Saprospiraceae bacterium]
MKTTRDEPVWHDSASVWIERLHSTRQGLQQPDAVERLRMLRQQERVLPEWWRAVLLFLRQFKNPLVLLLAVAVALAMALGDYTNSLIVLGILLLTGTLGFVQEYKADRAVKELRALVKTWVWVCRGGNWQKLRQEDIVEGDCIRLSAGDILPGDCILLEARDLHVNEAALSGESFPVEKEANPAAEAGEESARKAAVFQGSNVVSGTAEALVVRCGPDTKLGQITRELGVAEPPTAFEQGISRFGYLLIRLTLLLAVGILVFNILLGRPAVDSVFFALALAVGMAPELLPAIMMTTLSSGALRMAEQKVVVKKLNAIQNLGAIDVLCSDKTGTLTEGVVRVEAALDWQGQASARVRQYAFLNAFFESGFSNPLDEALRTLSDVSARGFEKVDEVPYDFIRKRLSVVVAEGERHWMITKGALVNVLEVCTKAETRPGQTVALKDAQPQIDAQMEQFAAKGFRVIGLAVKDLTGDPVINRDDEADMTFLGFILLYDPPKAGVAETLHKLHAAGVALKIISGDSIPTVRHTAELIGLNAAAVLGGRALDQVTDEALPALAARTTLFAEVEPHQKERLIRSLHKAGHVVGYLGDGINDAPALHAADVGISVDSGVDVAREAADIVLLDKDFEVLLNGIREGRRTYLNTLKYILITTSANFGNMFSLAGVSLLIPYLPLLPKQVLLLNFLSDIPALFIASDKVDPEMLEKPKQWNIALIRRFMFVFGAQSSLFDYLTFAALLLLFHVQESAFQTAWFVESVITEVLILLVIRTMRRAWKSRPSSWLLGAGLAVIALTLALPYLPFAHWFGFRPLPPGLLAGMAGIAGLYALLSEYVKGRFFKYAPI